MHQRDLMTLGDVARWACLGKSTVQRAVDNGKLRVCFYTPGGHRRFLRTDVAIFIESTLSRPTPPAK